MNDEQLEYLIAQTKACKLPDCPSAMEQNVLRRIRLSKSESEQSLGNLLIRLLSQPRILAAGLTIVGTISSGVTILSAYPDYTEKNSHQLAARALDFTVFDQTEILKFNDHK